MAKITSVIFPFKSPAGGTQPTLPACRAWRIIAVPVSYFGTAQPIIVDQRIAAPPSGCKDGIYPVWVKATRGNDDSELAQRRFIDGDGWQSDAMGRYWTIDYVASASADANSQRYAYIVETTDNLDDAGQVNSPIVAAARLVQTEVVLVTASATLISPLVGRKSVEIYNAGTNSIKVGSTSTPLRTIASNSAWALDYAGALYGQAITADQVAGAATIITELG